MQTTWIENYLDLSRWTIFIEDDQENQIEPIRVKEQTNQMVTMDKIAQEKFPGTKSKRINYFAPMIHQKQVFLYLPQFDIYGNPTIYEKMNFLKLVFLLEDGGEGRIEGMWKFQWHK